MIVGLTGTSGAGKDEVAKVLMKYGFSYHSLSDILRDEMKRKGVEDTLENITDFANDLRARDGANILARVVLERIRASGERHSLVVSIRNPSEVEELRKAGDFVMVAVDAPIEMRYERIQERQRPEDKISFEEFREIEERQKSEDPTHQELHKVIAEADFRIINDGTIDELHRKAEDLVDYLKQKGSEK